MDLHNLHLGSSKILHNSVIDILHVYIEASFNNYDRKDKALNSSSTIKKRQRGELENDN